MSFTLSMSKDNVKLPMSTTLEPMSLLTLAFFPRGIERLTENILNDD